MFKRLLLIAIGFSAVSAWGCTLVADPDEHFLPFEPSAVCDEYCSQFFDVCGNHSSNSYTDLADCHQKCDGISEGAITDYARNTVRCRMNHFGGAVGDPDLHCPHASFEGGEQCIGNDISSCEAFCGIFSEKCPDTFNALEGNPLSICIRDCGAFLPDTTDPDTIYVENRLACHNGFLDLMSAPSTPAPYCEAATPSNAVACSSDANATCDSLCLLGPFLCPDRFPDRSSCLDECGMAGGPQPAVCAIQAVTSGDCAAVMPVLDDTCAALMP